MSKISNYSFKQSLHVVYTAHLEISASFLSIKCQTKLNSSQNCTAAYWWRNQSGWNLAAALNQHPQHIRTHAHSNARSQADLCEPPVYYPCSQATVVMLWSESYNIPHNSSSQTPLSHVLWALLPLSDKSCTSCSLSHMSGAFSMALNAIPPYFIEHFVGWCWILPQCLAMGSCIRDVSSGRGQWKARRKEDLGGGSRCFSLFQWTA